MYINTHVCIYIYMYMHMYIYIYTMTHTCTHLDSLFTCVPGLIFMCVVSNSYVCHDSFVRVP